MISSEAGMPMALLQALYQRLRNSTHRFAISSGMLCGILIVCAVTPVRLLLGTDHGVDGAVIFSAALCYGLCSLLRNSLISINTDQAQSSRTFLNYGLPLAAAWTLFLPACLTLLLSLVGGFSLTSLESPLLSTSIITGIAFFCLLPVFAGIACSCQMATFDGPGSRFQWYASVTVSLLLLPTLVLPWLGTQRLTWVCLALSGCWLIARIRWPSTALMDAVSTEEQAITAGSLQSLLAGLTAVTIGAVLAVTLFTAGQLIPRNMIGDLSLVAGGLLGFAVPHLRGPRRGADDALPSLSLTCLLLAAWTGILVAGYPLWVLYCLKINAWVGSISLILTLRMAFLAILAFPIGLLTRRLTSNSQTRTGAAFVPVIVATGFLAVTVVPLAPQGTAASLVCISMCLALIARGRHNFKLPVSLGSKLATAGLSSAALLGVVCSENLDPARSERMLFSSAALQSLRQSVPAAQLNFLDDSRQLAEFSSLTHHFSLTKVRGGQIVLRQNGLVTGQHSGNPSVTPHHAGDILPALIPLVMHPQPENVLVLGVHPPTLMTCHAWPLRNVNCVDGAASAHDMVHWMTTHPVSGIDLTQGPDFHFHKIDPLLSLHARHGMKYDMITCPETHLATLSSNDQLTMEFYRRVQKHLNDGGIFSQRVPYYDVGPDYVTEIAGTLQTVFGEVVAIESIPGELIFLCSNSALPEVNEEMLERLKSPQSRTLLAAAGWDWSLILGRGAVKHDGWQKLCERNPRVNSCRDHRLSFSLPIEYSSWGQKGDKTRATLGEFGDTLRADLGDSPCGKEVSARLEDLNLAHQIQRDHPNDPWAYRAALKSRLQERPRDTIMQVNHQLKRVMDPEDQQRKSYLIALGPNAKNPNPTVEDINELLKFSAPFDPLVSLFVYFETSNMLSRCSPAQPDRQLHHLLHTVYYSSGYDQSVRNVSDALEILCQQQASAETEAGRWDEINSLLQIMAQRWQMRIASGRISRYEATDTDRCLRAIEVAMKRLESSHEVVGLTSHDWSMRKQTLEHALLRPVRVHRKERARDVPLAQVAAESDTADDTEAIGAQASDTEIGSADPAPASESVR